MAEIYHIEDVIDDIVGDEGIRVIDERDLVQHAFDDFYLVISGMPDEVLDEPVTINFSRDSIGEVLTFSQYAENLKHRILKNLSEGKYCGIHSMDDIVELLAKEGTLPWHAKMSFIIIHDENRQYGNES